MFEYGVIALVPRGRGLVLQPPDLLWRCTGTFAPPNFVSKVPGKGYLNQKSCVETVVKYSRTALCEWWAIALHHCKDTEPQSGGLSSPRGPLQALVILWWLSLNECISLTDI
jgi:hypothetical protein